jgi:DNA (cytosine-5)-methyltransferase 1
MKQINMFSEIIVDNFAGGGGASTGIEMAIGRSVDIAINHDPQAIAMHKANHPSTEHYQESVWDVDPIKAVRGRKVGLAWFSPDCKHFSRAKGKTPVNKNIRGLAWIAVKWAATVRPRVIMLENVKEFKTWGPLIKNEKGEYYPDPNKKGRTFEHFIKSLKKLGYAVEWNELKACDYGAPTIRERFFLIARCDGKPIIWPTPTHGKSKKLKPYRTAGEIIDWNIPCPSIFGRNKDLSENTLIRIGRGLKKFVFESNNPFIVKGSPSFLSQYYTQQSEESRCYGLDTPIATIPTANRFALVTAFISEYYSGFYKGAGSDLDKPVATITTKERHALVTAYVAQHYKTSIGHKIEEPLGTITMVNKASLVTAFLLKYYGADIGQDIDGPLHTVTSKDRFGLVTIKGQDYQIVDIGMRMLQPRELFNAQGFPEDYIIDHDFEGKAYPKTQQTARCGNAVPPPFANALVRSNLPELCDSEDTGRYYKVV